MKKPTMANLAKHLGMKRGFAYAMKRDRPKQFDLLWSGWVEYCKKENEKGSECTK